MKKGIFFRNPFFKKYYSLDAGFFDDLTPAPELKNLGLIHRLLNSRKTIAELIDFVENDDNAAGFKLCELRSPIFFEREERYAQLNSPNGVTIISKGWNFVDEEVGGACEVERTWVYRGGDGSGSRFESGQGLHLYPSRWNGAESTKLGLAEVRILPGVPPRPMERRQAF